jgi:lipoate-protein ligase A
MTSPIRILDTGLKPARWNVAMTAALAARHADGTAPDTIRFHRYPECVLLGRTQRPAQPVDPGHRLHRSVEIIHRVTGGGAVYLTPRMPAWDVIIDRRSIAGDLGSAARRICEGVAAGLSRLGCAARFRPANDIEIGGLKVSGSSGYAEGRTIVLQGTILIDDEVPAMAQALRISKSALRDSVTCLAAVLAATPSIARVQACVTEGLMAALDRTPLHQDSSPADLAAAEALLSSELGGDAGIMGDRTVRAPRSPT